MIWLFYSLQSNKTKYLSTFYKLSTKKQLIDYKYKYSELKKQIIEI